MALFSAINVHDCRIIKAEADKNGNTTWLNLMFSDYPRCELSIFMPTERAERIAAAINAVEREWQDEIAQEAEAEAGPQSYADEHRLRAHEVL